MPQCICRCIVNGSEWMHRSKEVNAAFNTHLLKIFKNYLKKYKQLFVIHKNLFNFVNYTNCKFIAQITQ